MKLHIHPQKNDIAALTELTESYRVACNFVSCYIFDHGFPLNSVELSKLLYQTLRTEYGLKSQLAQSCIKTVIARYKTIKDQALMENKKRELMTQDLSAGYDGKTIVSDVSITIPKNKISVILGANGCGKSTLLKTFAKLLKPEKGSILLDGKSIFTMPSKQMAQTLGLLPESPIVPEGIKVTDLVARGRFPYRKLLGGLQKEDFAAVEEALEMMGITELADRCVDELSGGQRQRVWIALALAQQTDFLLLDEPTTYLDIAYQVEILDLLMELNKKRGTTILMVLHDINLSARYADHIFAMSKGKLVAQGSPSEVISRELMKQIYGLDCQIIEDPVSGTPLIVPEGRHHRQQNHLVEKEASEENLSKSDLVDKESICA